MFSILLLTDWKIFDDFSVPMYYLDLKKFGSQSLKCSKAALLDFV
ncbi:hypothetical protein VL20_3207 [Microcystis panniformis FACHB-1757]|uniref:Uncharacterized protein n=1 Tax=Microcystis panniformis FACHB-1757 TaxID=1638788 RepID=A0A0K1S2E1_9CHRO|nr:hypothetical protein VL20_3207 [Microcystis panniformis FACHB-1757]